MTENPIIRIDQAEDVDPADRAGYQFPFMDEFVAQNVEFLHFECMGNAQFWAGVKVDGRWYHLNFGAVNTRAKGYSFVEADDGHDIGTRKEEPK